MLSNVFMSLKQTVSSSSNPHYTGCNHHLTQFKAVTPSCPLPLAGDLALVYDANLEVSTSGRYLRFLTLKMWTAVEMKMIKKRE